MNHFLPLTVSTKRIRGILLFFYLSTLLPLSCRHDDIRKYPYKNISFESIQPLQDETYTFSSKKLKYFIDSLRLCRHDTDYVDLACNNYYAENNPYLWIDRYGASQTCDTVLAWLKGIDTTGIPASRVFVSEIHDNLLRIRNMNFDKVHTISKTCATLEYYLTKGFLRYSCGQRFGFINPHQRFNKIEHTEDNDVKSPFKLLYDIPSGTPDKNFIHKALSSVTTGNTNAFLASIQPTSEIYHKLVNRLNTQDNTPAQIRTLAVNIERARWRIPQTEKEDVRIIINIPSQQLYAYDIKGDSSCKMKICFGSRKHKTPLLTSKLSHLELNPYWIIPQSIIRKEIVPLHMKDSDYFNRNRYKIIDKETGDFISPMDVDDAMMLTGRYRIRQDKGSDNSLGRMIFRFPNNFAIYLHDTNNKGAFLRSYRGVSHGCVRLEKPFQLARFLFGGKDEAYIDRIKKSVEYTDEELLENKHFVPLKTCFFEKSIHLYIIYFTCYPQPETGDIAFYSDIYGYDSIF